MTKEKEYKIEMLLFKYERCKKLLNKGARFAPTEDFTEWDKMLLTMELCKYDYYRHDILEKIKRSGKDAEIVCEKA